jgi:hypothetical protein
MHSSWNAPCFAPGPIRSLAGAAIEAYAYRKRNQPNFPTRRKNLTEALSYRGPLKFHYFSARSPTASRNNRIEIFDEDGIAVPRPVHGPVTLLRFVTSSAVTPGVPVESPDDEAEIQRLARDGGADSPNYSHRLRPASHSSFIGGARVGTSSIMRRLPCQESV